MSRGKLFNYGDPDFGAPLDRRLMLEHRISILEGLLAALDEWHEISGVVAESASVSDAQHRLTKGEFSFSDVVADHILNTPLRSLVGDYRGLVIAELDRFRAEQRDSGWSSE